MLKMISIELEIYQQYMDEARNNFEARNVQNKTVLNYDMHAKRGAKCPMLILNVSNVNFDA